MRGISRRWLALASAVLVVAALAVTSIASPAVAGDLSTRPDFRLPFGCGEAWQLTYKTHHAFPGKQVDFYLRGELNSAGYAVFVSAPGWVSDLTPSNGEVEINHGGGWFTTYQHMTDIGVSLGQYVGRGFVIGKVGNVNVFDVLHNPGPAHLHYEQAYQPGVTNANFDADTGPGKEYPYLEGQTFDLAVTGSQVRVSTNNCSGGAPGGAVQLDVPNSLTPYARSHATMEILARRSGDNALYERWYNGGWNGAPTGLTIAGQPAVIVFRGELHVIARRTDLTLFDYTYSPFSGWRTSYLGGLASDDPDAAVYGMDTNLHVSARGTDGTLMHYWSNGFGTWSSQRMDSMQILGTPAMNANYNYFQIIVRASDNSLWSWNHQGFAGTWSKTRLTGAAADSPDIGVDPQSRLVNVVARGTDDRIYRWQYLGLVNQAWSDPELVDANRWVTGAPALDIYHGAMHIISRDRGTSTIYHWWKDTSWHWEAPGGAYGGNPDITQFGDQFQTVGRGTDGNLWTVWYDSATGLWNIQYQGVAVAS